ncbi:MAG TPA: hypothetical protein V6D27_06040 [Vampirovibrionales bacterium]
MAVTVEVVRLGAMDLSRPFRRLTGSGFHYESLSGGRSTLYSVGHVLK